MTSRDTQERESRALGFSSPLFAIAQRVDADTQRFSEFLLRQASKAAEGRDIFFGIDLRTNDAQASFVRDGAAFLPTEVSSPGGALA